MYVVLFCVKCLHGRDKYNAHGTAANHPAFAAGLHNFGPQNSVAQRDSGRRWERLRSSDKRAEGILVSSSAEENQRAAAENIRTAAAFGGIRRASAAEKIRRRRAEWSRERSVLRFA